MLKKYLLIVLSFTSFALFAINDDQNNNQIPIHMDLTEETGEMDTDLSPEEMAAAFNNPAFQEIWATFNTNLNIIQAELLTDLQNINNNNNNMNT